MKIRRSYHNRWVTGLCGGIARAFKVPSFLVRLVALGLFSLNPIAFLVVYLILSMIIPFGPGSHGEPGQRTASGQDFYKAGSEPLDAKRPMKDAERVD